MAASRFTRRWHLRARRLAAGIVLCAMAFAATVGPAAADGLGDAFVETWTTRDGLPHSTVNGIGQTADGFLWLATWEGVARYDGHDFRLYRRSDVPGLGDDSVRALGVGPRGAVWFGSARGGVVRRRDGRWDALPPVGGLVTDLLETPHGDLWIALARGGVVHVEASGRRTVLSTAQGLPSPTVNGLAQDARGRVWAATSLGLARVDGRRAVPTPALPAAPVFSVVALADGRIAAATEHGAQVGDGTVFAPAHPALADVTATRLLADRDGVLWVGTNNRGLARVQGTRIEWLDSRRGLPNDRILALRRDAEGSLWVGTNGGLARLRAAPIHTFTRLDGLADDFIRATLATADGAVWVGSGQGLDRLDPTTGAARHVGSGTPLGRVSVLSLADDGHGGLWVGTFHDGALHVGKDTVTETLTMAAGLPSNEVRAILPARDGAVWIGTKQGLVEHRSGGTRVYGTGDGLPSEYVQALHEADDGAIWVGTGAGAARVQGGRVTAVDLAASDAQYVYGFLPASAAGAVWMATDRGLVRVTREGAVRRIDRSSGLPFEKIFSVLGDRRGRLWLTGNEGIARVSLADAEAAADGTRPRVDAHLFGRTDGMLSAQANGGSSPSASLDRRGRVWVATAIGVARLDPGAVDRHALPLPPVTIERLEVDGRDLTGTPAPELGPGDHRIVVRFVSPTLVNARRVRYRYRLDGLHEAWVDLGDSREVQFTRLGPGRFRLQVAASVPGEPGVARGGIEFAIAAFWWQRPLVWLLLGVLACGVLGAAYALRIRQLRRNERRLRALVDERTAALRVQTQVAERLARTDALTMLSNRRALDHVLEHELDEVAQGHDVSLLLIDVDGFKPINDLHGHPAGDCALRAVADAIRGLAREQDMAARWGGDEFALLLVDCDLVRATAVAERLRAAVQRIDCGAFAPGLGMSASIGVASTAGNRRLPPRSLVARADEALYRAKREGRNRVCAAIASELVP